MKSLQSTMKSLSAALLLTASLGAHAALTDIAPAPLVTTPTASVLPNVFLMMDDSGSMGWDYMPDNAKNFGSGTYGAASPHCNGVFYDPTITYAPPVDSLGVSYPNATFAAAWTDGYNTAGGTVNLSTSFVDTGKDPAQAAFYYSYTGAQTTEKLKDYYNTASTFYKECNSTVGSAPGNGVFSKVTVGAAEQQNFANWYSYYRTRILMMKTATGLAFKTIGGNFRVGLATMNNNTGSDYLTIAPFDPAQKAAWYAKLYATRAGNSTPLREALANVGRMYAMKLPGNKLNGVAVVDPIEYSCQQNFTILTTDGFWNGATTYDLAGGTVGNQDGNEVRPMYDGTIQSKTTVQNLQTDKQTTKSTSQDQQWTQQLQTQTSNLQQQTGPLQWQTNQQQTTATLQWQTNLQKTTAPLQWQTNLQKTTAPLQWQTNLQKTTYQLAMWTDQMQVTAPLLRATNLQSATAALQWQTNLQATSGTLQKQTSQLQTQTTQLQARTSQLQQQTSQLQSSTSQLQSSTMYLQQSTSTNKGGTWSAWTDAASCTWKNYGNTGKSNWTRCQYATAPVATSTAAWTAAGATWTNVASCTQVFSTGTSGTWSGNGTSCQYAPWTVWANSATCTAAAQSVAPNYTVGTATQCRTVVTAAFANTATCTDTTGTPDVTGQTTQCQYTGWTGWAGTPACTPLAQSAAPNYTVGTATQCQSVVTSAWANTAACNATTVPNASGNTTQCQYAAYSAWANVGAGGSCTTLAQSAGPAYTGPATNCQLTGVATAYVTLASGPSCSVTYNNPGTSTADASGKAVSACGNTGATYSAAANVGAGNSCTPGAILTGTGGGSVLCAMAAVTPAYVAAYPPTCTTTYNAIGTSTANGAGNVTVCSNTGATYSTPVAVGGGGVCDATKPNVQCSIGAASAPAYVTNYPVPSCTVTYNALGASTASAGGSVVTSCPTDGSGSPSFKLSPATPVGPNGTCDWSAPHAGNLHMWCDINTATGATNYVASYPPTCATTAATFVTPYWYVTADASGNYTAACTVNAAYSAATTVAAGGTCSGGPNVGSPWGDAIQCATGAATTSYVNTYPPTCAVSYNGAAGTSTATGTSVVTACPVNAALSAATSVGGGGTCNGTLPNVFCATGATTTAAITTYPPTCAISYNGAAASTTADAGGNVITACPVMAPAGTYTAGTNVAAGGTCDATLPNVRCATTGATTAYVTNYPPTCAIDYFGATGTTTVPAGGKVTTACPVNAVFNGWTNTAAAGSCTPGANVNCQYAWGAWANAGACTTNFSSGAGAWTVTTGTNCQYTPFTAWANYAATSCTAVAASAASPYTVGLARNCQVVNVTTPANTPANPAPAWVSVSPASCAATAPVGTFDATGKNVQCQTVTTGPTPVLPTSCTANIAAAAGNNWTSTTCATTTINLNMPVASCTAGTGPAPNYLVTTCPAPITTGPTNMSGCVAEAASAANNWTTTTCTPVSGGTTNTLADVAEYYYVTDLRTVALGNQLSGAPGAVNGSDISANNVPSSGLDSASHQHMTTFTLGLGARGRMVFDPSYQTATTGDFFAVKQGSTANSATGVCTWQANNTICNWPFPASNAIENVDDLWHAAVNGRGTYFSAANPSDLSIALTSALSGVSARLGSSAAATTSTAFITQGDNFLFRSSYVSMDWVGNLIRQQLDVITGAVLPTVDWSAQTLLDTRLAASTTAYTGRNIYFFNSLAANNLSLFNWANLSFVQQGYFSSANMAGFAQFCAAGATCLSPVDQALAGGANLVNFIRGERVNEGALAANTKYYRQRKHVLGDVVNSESVYIKKALASFSDPGYGAWSSSAAITGRQPMVYVGINDGMLHAFYAANGTAPITGGDEAWAFIPSAVMPNLYKLADKGYDLKHQYYVDGTPVPADICISNCLSPSLAVWKTILVGGLNDGGMEYFALDVTDPLNPKALWEFTNLNLGYTFGNPKVVKLKTGQWVVLVTSGYNNFAGDGQGHLFVLDAWTGALIRDIATGVGTAASPSGLSRIEAPVATPGVDATVLAVYGGDVLGNLWRFDVNDDLGAPGFDAQLIATLKDSLGNAQPITSKPLVTLVGTTIVVDVGTGRYLGSSDLPDTSQQSFYAIKDTFPAGTTPSVAIFGDPRTQGSFVKQTQTTTLCPVNTAGTICSTGQTVVISANTAVNFSSNGGWYFDFPLAGERNNTDPAIIRGTLLLTTNVPSASSCSVGGDSYLYQLDYRNGGSVTSSTTGVIATKLGNELASRPVVATLADGTSRAYVQGSGGGTPSSNTVWKNDNSDGIVRRVSWRELFQ